MTFYSTLKKYRSADYALNNSGWTLLHAAEQIFKLSKERVFNSKDEFDPESCPKWKALSDILRVEIPSDIKSIIQDEAYEFDREKQIKILVLCNDSRTSHQINYYLTQGLERTLFYAAMRNDVPVQKLSKKYEKVTGIGSVKDCMNVQRIQDPQPSAPTTEKSKESEKIPLRLAEKVASKRKLNASHETKNSEELQSVTSKETFDFESTEDTDILRDTFILTMSQQINGNETILACDFDTTLKDHVKFETYRDDNLEESLNVSNIVAKMEKPTVFIQTFRSDILRMSSLSQTLQVSP